MNYDSLIGQLKPDQSGTINSGGNTRTESSWTETFIRSIPKLLVWIIAIGISAPVLMKATVTKISKDHLTCSIQWDSVQRNHEQKFSDLCEKNLTTVKHHSNFITETHGTEWFEAKLESCLDKNTIKNDTCLDKNYIKNDTWQVCMDTKMSTFQRYYWSGSRSSQASAFRHHGKIIEYRKRPVKPFILSVLCYLYWPHWFHIPDFFDISGHRILQLNLKICVFWM